MKFLASVTIFDWKYFSVLMSAAEFYLASLFRNYNNVETVIIL